jgi:hypothetical protein
MSPGDLTMLQAARLKGRLRSDVAEQFDPDAPQTLARLEQAGLVQLAAAGARLTPAGRAQLQELLKQERGQVDRSQLEPLYKEFDEPNTRLKATITRWQVRPDGAANDHNDIGYDSAVVAELAACHDAAAPLVKRLAAVVPRLAHYPRRFSAAIGRATAGDVRAVAHPLDDSYHQIWFELHEDLLGLLGLSREAEATAGRAE